MGFTGIISPLLSGVILPNLITVFLGPPCNHMPTVFLCPAHHGLPGLGMCEEKRNRCGNELKVAVEDRSVSVLKAKWVQMPWFSTQKQHFFFCLCVGGVSDYHAMEVNHKVWTLLLVGGLRASKFRGCQVKHLLRQRNAPSALCVTVMPWTYVSISMQDEMLVL